jgi:hypothetical protein
VFEIMQVMFVKLSSRHYGIIALRADGSRMLGPGPRGEAPGFDEFMPHDMAHFIVELEAGVRLGVFGQLAAGAAGIFRPDAVTRKAKLRRQGRLAESLGKNDLMQAERLAQCCVPEWERRSGRRSSLPDYADLSWIPGETLDRILRRLDRESRRWRALQVGQSMTLEWPAHLTVKIRQTSLGRARRSGSTEFRNRAGVNARRSSAALALSR